MSSIKVELAAQVVEFVRCLSPEPRKRLRDALKKLEKEQGDIKPLQHQLENYYRLRVGPYRVIFWYKVAGVKRTLRCEFAEHRGVVYEAFSAIARQLRD